MSKRTLLIVSVLTLMLSTGIGCRRSVPRPRHIVVLIDVSASIEPDAMRNAFKAVDELLGGLRRGERLSIIPITGDALNDAPGRILRFEVPSNRAPYDTDLERFRKSASDQLTVLRATGLSHPESHTDILGSLTLAQEELAIDHHQRKPEIIILSDLIHDADGIDFFSDARLADAAHAQSFAATEAAKCQPTNLRGAPVFLGMLPSNDLRRMLRSRRDALSTFWRGYLEACGATPTQLSDGAGSLRAFFRD